jgi:hypothetical protein
VADHFFLLRNLTDTLGSPGGVQGQEHVLDVMHLSGAGIIICSEARRVASARAGLETRSRNITYLRRRSAEEEGDQLGGG